MTLPTFSLKDSLDVKAIDQEHVSVTVILPVELIQSYCRLLESLAEFFHVADRKSTVALAPERNKVRSLEPEVNKHIEDYRQRVVTSFVSTSTKASTAKQLLNR